MKIIVGLLLVATALAYPVAENEAPKPGVPLVITDYSSVAKADEAKAPQKQAHEENSSQQDSAESSESVESGEKQPLVDVKPRQEEQKPVEVKQDKPLSDEVSPPLPTTDEKKPAEVTSLVVPEQKLPEAPLTAATLIENKVEVESKKEKKEIAEENNEATKPVATEADQTKTVVEPVVENKSADLVPVVKRIDETEEKKVEEPVPAVKSIPQEEKVVDIKSEESAPVPALNPAPAVKSEAPTGDKVADEIFGEKVKEPLALPAQGVTHDVPASDDVKLTEEVIKPSEQKVEAGPVAEETGPQIKLTEAKPTEEGKPLIVADNPEVKKEGLPEVKNVDAEKKAKAEGDVKPEEKLPEVAGLPENVETPVAKRIEEVQPELKASAPEPKAESLPEVKAEAAPSTVAPGAVTPKVEEPKKEEALKKEVLPEKLPEPSSASS